MSEEEISPLSSFSVPSFSLEDSEKEDGAFVMVRFNLRQDHNTFLYTWRLHFSASGPNSLTGLTWAYEENFRPHPESTSDQTSLNQSYTTFRQANNQYKILFYQYRNPSRSHPRLWHDLATVALLTAGWHVPRDSRIRLRHQIILTF